ncbi:hypothetical protein CEXT_280081 [Caerostris extrusa]|uniref:TGF-beta family profile domain-containing protein n=1 Tax=Caerostris extrusa TaxID=172846 RepID=A0AAV4MGQ0_CAEEX|nr:hypothetical protein CEXT_280081 [Caerostris extrusa]
MEAKQKHPNLKLTCIDCCNTQLEIMVKESPARSGRPPCSGHCCKRHLKINFKEIGWDWVVEPKEFDAFICKGKCKKADDDFSSTHALMQSLLRLQGNKVPYPCCVPGNSDDLIYCTTTTKHHPN